MKVKICGLQPTRDVQLCVDLGVNYLGFVFYEKSPRNLKLEDVKKLKNFNKKNSFFVAVTVNPSDEFIKNVVLNKFDFIQLHGSETKSRIKEIKAMGLKVIKAIKVKKEADIYSFKKYEEADIILFGVSRTSKTPTSIYLANKGIKVANIPFVLNQEPNLSNVSKNSLVVGLFASPERLQQIRTSRLKSLKEKNKTEYINIDFLEKEVIEAKKICLKNKWVTIDVTKKSIEEIAATVLEYYKIFKKRNNDK